VLGNSTDTNFLDIGVLHYLSRKKRCESLASHNVASTSLARFRTLCSLLACRCICVDIHLWVQILNVWSRSQHATGLSVAILDHLSVASTVGLATAQAANAWSITNTSLCEALFGTSCLLLLRLVICYVSLLPFIHSNSLLVFYLAIVVSMRTVRLILTE
jgi:hypothetical protein